MKTIVWHGNCHDGVTALFAALEADPDAEQYEGRYDAAPELERLRGRDVVFVDFCWKPPVMAEVRRVARSVLVLDHHAIAMQEMTAVGGSFIDMGKWSPPFTWARHLQNAQQDIFEGAHDTIYLLFDMERSGAGLAWDFFHPTRARPPLIDYVEDRDLWRFRLPYSREVHAACGSYALTLAERRALMTRPIGSLMNEGTSILRYHDKLVASAAQHAGRETIGGHEVPSIACPVIEIASDLGHVLAKGQPFAAIHVDRADGSRVYQLRSTPEGLDVGAIAAQHGGGGHRNAAGFTRKAVRE